MGKQLIYIKHKSQVACKKDQRQLLTILERHKKEFFGNIHDEMDTNDNYGGMDTSSNLTIEISRKRTNETFSQEEDGHLLEEDTFSESDTDESEKPIKKRKQDDLAQVEKDSDKCWKDYESIHLSESTYDKFVHRDFTSCSGDELKSVFKACQFCCQFHLQPKLFPKGNCTHYSTKSTLVAFMDRNFENIQRLILPYIITKNVTASKNTTTAKKVAEPTKLATVKPTSCRYSDYAPTIEVKRKSVSNTNFEQLKQSHEELKARVIELEEQNAILQHKLTKQEKSQVKSKVAPSNFRSMFNDEEIQKQLMGLIETAEGCNRLLQSQTNNCQITWKNRSVTLSDDLLSPYNLNRKSAKRPVVDLLFCLVENFGILTRGRKYIMPGDVQVYDDEREKVTRDWIEAFIKSMKTTLSSVINENDKSLRQRIAHALHEWNNKQ